MNCAYILLRAAYWEQATQFWHVCGTLVTWILQYVAFHGILSSSEIEISKQRQSSTTDLAGGVFLDLLGLTLLVQFGTALWTSKVYWLLALVPPVGLWKLYSSFQSSMQPGAGQSTTPTAVEETNHDEKMDKRRKRSERRRQKWS
jgi:hypothetical protein